MGRRRKRYLLPRKLVRRGDANALRPALLTDHRHPGEQAGGLHDVAVRLRRRPRPGHTDPGGPGERQPARAYRARDLLL